jgi:hypothetical protein
VDYVLRHASCKVMVGATPEWRGPRRPAGQADERPPVEDLG